MMDSLLEKKPKRKPGSRVLSPEAETQVVGQGRLAQMATQQNEMAMEQGSMVGPKDPEEKKKKWQRLNLASTTS